MLKRRRRIFCGASLNWLMELWADAWRAAIAYAHNGAKYVGWGERPRARSSPHDRSINLVNLKTIVILSSAKQVTNALCYPIAGSRDAPGNAIVYRSLSITFFHTRFSLCFFSFFSSSPRSHLASMFMDAKQRPRMPRDKIVRTNSRFFTDVVCFFNYFLTDFLTPIKNRHLWLWLKT